MSGDKWLTNLFLRCILLLLSTLTVSNAAYAQGQAIAFEGVNIIPMDRNTLVRNQRVIVLDGVIDTIETTKKIADAFDVTLNHLVDETTAGTFDKKTVQRIQDLQSLPDEEQRHMFAIVGAFLRDARARVAYS